MRSKATGFASLLLLLLATRTAFSQAPDPNIVFSEPAPGQVFAPGDEMLIAVRIKSPRQTDAIVSVAGLGLLIGSNDGSFDGSAFRWRFRIPPEFAGPLTLTPMVIEGADPARPDTPLTIAGIPLTVTVRPREAPMEIMLAEHNFYLEPDTADTQCLRVQGAFANAVTRDLTSPLTGTTYHSSSPAVVTVDREGCVSIRGPGIATVTVENRGVKDFAIFVIEDQRHPLPPEDLTDKVIISRSDIKRDATAKAYNTYPLSVQTITITNTSDEPIVGPLYLTVRELPKDVELWLKVPNAPANPPPDMILYFGRTAAAGASVPVPLTPKDGHKVNPGETVSTQLYFLGPADETRYRLGVVRSMDERQIQ